MAESEGCPSQKSDVTEYDFHDFARLTPVNIHAKRYFSEVARMFDMNREWHTFSRPFISYSRCNDGGGYQGYYRLSLDIAPANLRDGWFAGSGETQPKRPVEILLAPTIMAGKIQPRHFRLYHAARSGRLMLQARHEGITVNGVDSMQSKHALVVDQRTGIAIFGFMYKLEITAVASSTLYDKQIQDNITNHQSDLTPSVTPTPASASVGPWRYYPAFEAGATSTVYRGYHHETDEEVVIKRVKRQCKEDRDMSAMEIRLLRMIRSHAHICSLRDIQESSIPGIRVDETILILSPAASFTLNRFPKAVLGPSRPNLDIAEDILDLWRDCLDALVFLHGRHPLPIIHRDIKPQNIGVHWQGRWQAVVLDFGHAIDAATSRDHRKGTIRYLSPEVMALKQWDASPQVGSRPPHFGTPTDVYGLAIAFSEVFWGRRISREPWPGQDRDQFNRHFAPPVSQTPNDHWGMFSRQVGQAATWSQEERPKASDLLHCVEEFQQAYQPKRKRALILK